MPSTRRRSQQETLQPLPRQGNNKSRGQCISNKTGQNVQKQIQNTKRISRKIQETKPNMNISFLQKKTDSYYQTN